jgi:glutamate dehydrogenase
VFFALGAELRVDWIERELARVRSASRMQRWALQALREDLFRVRRELAERTLGESEGADPLVAVARFLEARADRGRRLATFLRALAREGDPDLAGLTLAVRQLRGVV